MFQENLVMRNLSILQTLTKSTHSGASLEELAQAVKCREGDLSAALRILQDQGLISQSEKRYHLADHASTERVLETINPWIAHFNGHFYDIATDTARAIHEKSWDQNGVIDVLLYGSTVRSASPKDIDLLVIHNSGQLKAFSPYSSLRVDDPVGEENGRDNAYHVFRQLGYKHDERERDSVVLAVGKRIEGLHAGTITEEKISAATERLKWINEKRDVPYELGNIVDFYGINNIFDVNVLHVGALKADAQDQFHGQRLAITGMRKAAIDSCRDPTFWHTILSEGRIYDRTKHDFSLRVEDKYPGALDLFPSK